jgi:hypothetical protein
MTRDKITWLRQYDLLHDYQKGREKKSASEKADNLRSSHTRFELYATHYCQLLE